MEQVKKALRFANVSPTYRNVWVDDNVTSFSQLDEHITNLSEGKRLVLMIDEVDKISNNRVFLHFLGMLRDKFNRRKAGKDYTFHSVILVGVYDIRNIKLKMINGVYLPHDSEKQLKNSPWNIAVPFEVEMSFSPAEIATMLQAYESDHKTGMDISNIAAEIYSNTSGYPFLVSRICQFIHEAALPWEEASIGQAVKKILNEKNTLFSDIIKNLKNNSTFADMMYQLTINGASFTFVHDSEEIELGVQYGILKNVDGRVAVANRIFEILITNYFISRNEIEGKLPQITGMRDEIIVNGKFS